MLLNAIDVNIIFDKTSGTSIKSYLILRIIATKKTVICSQGMFRHLQYMMLKYAHDR